MLSLHPARQRGNPSSRNTARIGIAIAGGGPIGGMYELGALRALDEAHDGLDLTDLDRYVGVSSGAFLARSEEHTSELQPLMRISYSVFRLTKKTSLHHQQI